MNVLAFASQKGGVGKTTLCGHLAVEAERRGAGPVAVIDTDPQANLSQWWEDRHALDIAHTPVIVRLSVADLKDGLTALRRQKIALVLIDTRSGILSSEHRLLNDINSIVQAADLLVIPTRPGPHDTRAIGGTFALAEQHGVPWITVINGAPPRSKPAEEARARLAEEGPVARTIIRQRQEFSSSMNDGRTVLDTNPEGPSAAEIRELWTTVNRALNRKRGNK